MSTQARPARPLLVTLVALLALALVVWYAVFLAEAVLLFVGEFLFGGPAPVPAEVRFGPIALAGAGLATVLWSLVTMSGLMGGAWWSRFSAVLLAFFALPLGYPTDLIVTAIVVLLLFVPSKVRAFFGW